jgi:hypothetical protein
MSNVFETVLYNTFFMYSYEIKRMWAGAARAVAAEHHVAVPAVQCTKNDAVSLAALDP